MRNYKEYAVYKGEQLLAVGTAMECAEELNVKPETIHFYTTPTYKRRLKKRKNPSNCRIAVKLD
ncbi:hypothetical protein [Priestia megaterium]|uniref:hypothetical protein n=1 Tax=Priestia megaterium TaxID=1404 RepID=UPI000BEBB231|nr:hypothetical protein [Priestia megaterium]PED63993.1 hypothetical protein CON20_23810 [Priestia megaterium]